MDIRFPEFPAHRESGSEPASRKSQPDNSDFAAMLDRSADEPKEKPRDVASEKPAAKADDSAAKSEPGPEPRDPAEANAAPRAEQPAETTQPAPADKPVQNADNKPADATPPDTQGAAPAAAPVAPSPPPMTAPVSDASTKPVQPAQQSGAPQAAPPIPDTPAPVDGAATPVQQTSEKPAPQADFAGTLAAAATQAPETAPVKPTAAPKTPAKTTPSTGSVAPADTKPEAAPVATAAAVQAASSTSDALSNDPRKSAEATTTAPQANAQPTAAGAGAAVPAAPQASSEPADDAQIVAVVRPAANPAATDRPAAAKETLERPAPPADPLAKDLPLDAKPPAPAKPDAPSRPFGAVAPGLSIAAQAAAQQTPEQANAAERLAQVAAAAANEAEANAKPAPATDALKSAEAGTPASRTDQVGQIDAAGPRHGVTDAAAANAAARSARPNFHPVVTQIAAHVAQAAIDGNDRISIRLSPAELGRIDVKLEFGPDGRVQAVFAADRAQTVDLLQRDARDLERALQDAGLRADSGSLSFNLRGENRDGSQQGMAGQHRRDEPAAETNSAQLQAYAAGAGSSGRLDLRI